MKCKFLKAMCAALALCLLSTAALAAAFTPGTYTGAGEGYKGDELKVEVTLGEDRIESIKVLENQETPTIGGAAMEALTAQIVEKQSLDVYKRQALGCVHYLLGRAPTRLEFQGGCL